MKSIELTNDHRTKLLEMCVKLFPEYTDWKFGRNWDNYELWFVFKRKCFEIHWFEFMMTELVEKILNPNPLNPNRGLQNRFKDFFWEVNHYWMHNKLNVEGNNESTKPLHPIDYLYEEFKKLKK